MGTRLPNARGGDLYAYWRERVSADLKKRLVAQRRAAGPGAAAGTVSVLNLASQEYFKAVQQRIKTFVELGQLGPFANGYWGHPAMKLSPEVNLLAVAHYLQALDYQRKVNQVVAILGSKTPNIQNLAVGGVANEAHVYKVADGSRAATLKGHQGALFSVLFHPKNPELATGGYDGHARLLHRITVGERSAH